MSNQAYVNGQSNNGTCTVTAPTAPGVVWNLTSLQVSQAGGSVGPNGKLTIYDGPVATGAVLYAAYLSSPGAQMFSAPGAVVGGLGGSVGIIQEIPLPKSPQGVHGLQASPGNQMTIQVIGTGANQVSINARFSDGLP